jgi:hypothetical protein
MQPVIPTSQMFSTEQQRVFSVEFFDTPMTPLEGNAASGGVQFDLVNPKADGTWGLPAYIAGAATNVDISATFLSSTFGTLGYQNGRLANVIGYWAGGSPAEHGGTTNGAVAYHFYGKLRAATARSWFDATTTPTWYLALAGQGFVRVDTKVGATVTTIFNGQLSEFDYLTNGFQISATINTMVAGSELHIYYVQSKNDGWGGLVVKAIQGAAPSARSGAQVAAAAAPVLGCGLVDDGIVSVAAPKVLTGIKDIEVSHKRKQASGCSFMLPLINNNKFDGVGWEHVKNTADDPGYLNMWNGAQTPAFSIRRSRLVRVKMGYVSPQGQSNELYTVFTGFIDDFDNVASGTVTVRCVGYAGRLLQQYDKNFPDKISYMSRGYRTLNGAETGTAEPTYDTPALDNWPMEYAISELLTRKGVDAMCLTQPLVVPLASGSSATVIINTETYLKFRARTMSGKQLRVERSVHYGNNGVKFNESLPTDDEYVFKPENTKEIWKRIQEITDRYGYEISFDEFGHCKLQPINTPHSVFDIAATDATVGTLTKKVNPNAYAGNYYEASGAVTIRKTVVGARIDACLPRDVGLAAVTCNIYRSTAPSTIISTTALTPASTAPAYFYDFRSTVDGTNTTVQTVYTGDFNTYIVEFVVASGTSRFDSIFAYHTDPNQPLLPQALSTAKNAISINTKGGMDDARNMVTVVGRRKGTVTDSDKFADVNNPENEFVISRAVDVPSIVDPSATNYAGYVRETVIYNKDITDDDFAQYLSRSFIYRQRVPAPSAPIEHTLLPCVQLRDPVFAVDSLYDTIYPTEVLYVQAITHRMRDNGSSISMVETSGYPEFPSFEPREDIDIDQPEFGGFPVSNVSISYTSLTGQVKTNLSVASLKTSVGVSAPSGDIVSYAGVAISGGALQLGALNAHWPPLPGSFFIKPNLALGTTTQVVGPQALLAPGHQLAPLSIPDGVSISSVTLTRYARSTYNSGSSFGVDTFPITQNANDSAFGFYYQWDQNRDIVTVKRAQLPGQNLLDPSSTVGYVPTVTFYKGNYGLGSNYITNNPYHHFFDIDYRLDSTARRNVKLSWIQGDNTSAYTLPGTITSCDVLYRRLGPTDANGYFVDPYAGSSPFYDPYTSELGYVVTTTFDALVSGRYRISVRDIKTDQVVAWLTEPTSDADDENAHWSFLGAGAGKVFTWDGVDQVGAWNKLQSQAYADASHGEFEQDEAPIIGKGFYVWNREVDDGLPGPLALISGDLQGANSHPVITRVGAPVFGVSTYGSFYVKIEAQNDNLMATAGGGVRTMTTTTKPPAGVTSLYASAGTQALIYTHLPRPSGLELTIADWVSATPYTTATDSQKADPLNWSSATDADATVRNDKPVRVRFVVQPRPGVLWINKQTEVSIKLTRVVHPRIHIFDQYVVWDGTNFAGTDIVNRRVESRRLVNDSHTIRYTDTGYRKAKDFLSATNPQGTQWVFSPSDFKKNFRGVDNEPLIFGDYLQLEEVPKWDTNRQIGGTRARLQLAFLNYLWYLSAYTQDRSGKMVWSYNPQFVDKSKLTTNKPSDWYDTQAALTTNLLVNSNNGQGAGWTMSGGTALLNAVGFDGLPNTATTITDNSAVAYGVLQQAKTIPNDSNPVAAAFWIAKDAVTNRFPQLLLSVTGGTTTGQRRACFNTSTGTFTTVNTTGPGLSGTTTVTDEGLWWKVVITFNNNSTGNVTATAGIYAAPNATQGGVDDVAVQGSVVMLNMQIAANASTISGPIVTGATAVSTPSAPTATLFSYKVPASDDPTTLHRRTVVCRQWTDEKVNGVDWKTREKSKWAFTTGSIGDQLLRHKWRDHDPRSTTINGVTWASLSLDQDHYSQNLRITSPGYLDDSLAVSQAAELAYPADAVNRQLGTHSTGATKLANWTWETAPLWIPCVTRDFFPYFLVPPMPDQPYGTNLLARRFIYATVDERIAGANNTGDDIGAGDTWSSATAEMTQLDTVQALQGATAKNIVNRFWQGSRVRKDQRPTYNTDQQYWMDYSRTDQLVHFEDLRGLYSRGPKPTEPPKKVTPVQPYYVNPMQYDSFRYLQAYRNPSFPKYSVRVTRWFDMKFRSEYFVESGAYFPTDQYGAELLAAINYRLMRGVNMPGQLPGQIRYDSGAWVGWKDDADTGTAVTQGDPTIAGDQARSVFNRKTLIVGVGPRMAVTKDMIFQMVLVNLRREVAATES